MKQIIYHHFGLGRNPWAAYHATADAQRVGIAVAAALDGSAMVAISGARGSGKTYAVWRELESSSCTVIEPLRLDREQLHIGDIMVAIISTLSDESPRHSAEARAAQALRMLRVARQPLLLIDEAHLLHHSTVRALKRLREMGTRGSHRRMLPILLLGQADPTARVAEARLRTEAVALSGLTTAEVRTALTPFRKVLESAAVAAIATREDARNWLDLQRLVDAVLAHMMHGGLTRATAAVVAAALDGEGDDAVGPSRPASAPPSGRVAGLLTDENVTVLPLVAAGGGAA